MQRLCLGAVHEHFSKSSHTPSTLCASKPVITLPSRHSPGSADDDGLERRAFGLKRLVTGTCWHVSRELLISHPSSALEGRRRTLSRGGDAGDSGVRAWFLRSGCSAARPREAGIRHKYRSRVHFFGCMRGVAAVNTSPHFQLGRNFASGQSRHNAARTRSSRLSSSAHRVHRG